MLHRFPLSFGFLALLVLTLGGCSTGRVSFKGKPDAYAVVARSGLETPPPGAGLPRPQPPGTGIKDPEITQAMAKQALAINGDGFGGDPQALAQFRDYADPRIAAQIDYEAYQNQNTSGRPAKLLDNVLAPIQGRRAETGPGTPLDVAEELTILHGKGVATTSGAYAVDGHNLEVLQLGQPKYFDPATLLRQMR